jgi:hypothetical protein
MRTDEGIHANGKPGYPPGGRISLHDAFSHCFAQCGSGDPERSLGIIGFFTFERLMNLLDYILDYAQCRPIALTAPFGLTYTPDS